LTFVVLSGEEKRLFFVAPLIVFVFGTYSATSTPSDDYDDDDEDVVQIFVHSSQSTLLTNQHTEMRNVKHTNKQMGATGDNQSK
jgi:hypothetical protein